MVKDVNNDLLLNSVDSIWIDKWTMDFSNGMMLSVQFWSCSSDSFTRLGYGYCKLQIFPGLYNIKVKIISSNGFIPLCLNQVMALLSGFAGVYTEVHLFRYVLLD